jgi:hypothetical protein
MAGSRYIRWTMTGLTHFTSAKDLRRDLKASLQFAQTALILYQYQGRDTHRVPLQFNRLVITLSLVTSSIPLSTRALTQELIFQLSRALNERFAPRILRQELETSRRRGFALWCANTTWGGSGALSRPGTSRGTGSLFVVRQENSGDGNSRCRPVL